MFFRDTYIDFWKEYAIDKVYLVKLGLFLVRFTNVSDQLEFLQREAFYFDRKSFIVKPWNPQMDLDVKAITPLPIWVQFPELDLKYWGVVGLSKIGSSLGIPQKTDKYTKETTMLQYARTLIDMPLQENFSEYIKFLNDHDVLVRQRVRYEWTPTKCAHCETFGHLEEDYRKKSKVRKEWRPVIRPTQAENPQKSNCKTVKT